MLCNVTAAAADWSRLEPQLADFLGALPHTPVKAAPWQVADTPRAEGLIIPAKVNYVGKGADLYRAGVKPSGAHIVARRYLRTTSLRPGNEVHHPHGAIVPCGRKVCIERGIVSPL